MTHQCFQDMKSKLLKTAPYMFQQQAMLPSHRPSILSHVKQGKTLRLDTVVLRYSEDKVIALGIQRVV